MIYNKNIILSFLKKMLEHNKIKILDIDEFLDLKITNYTMYDAYLDIDFSIESSEVVSITTTDIIGVKKVVDNVEIIYEVVVSKGKVKHLNIWSVDRKKLPYDKLFLVYEN